MDGLLRREVGAAAEEPDPVGRKADLIPSVMGTIGWGTDLEGPFWLLWQRCGIIKGS